MKYLLVIILRCNPCCGDDKDVKYLASHHLKLHLSSYLHYDCTFDAFIGI